MSKIILYTQPSCPPCEVTKMFLQENGIAYTEKNIKADRKVAIELMKKYQSYSTPTIIIDDQVIRGFDLEKLKQVLQINEQ